MSRFEKAQEKFTDGESGKPGEWIRFVNSDPKPFFAGEKREMGEQAQWIGGFLLLPEGEDTRAGRISARGDS